MVINVSVTNVSVCFPLQVQKKIRDETSRAKREAKRDARHIASFKLEDQLKGLVEDWKSLISTK